jgi:hypothetical protein
VKPLLVSVVVGALSLLSASGQAARKPDSLIRPGEVWLDNRVVPIQAHGGGMLQMGRKYFWFGEDRSPDITPQTRVVSCFESTDLAHWTFRGHALEAHNLDGLGNSLIVERPKVFYNAKTNRYVMYFHLDGLTNGKKYGYARVGVAVSDRVEGPYKYLKSFRPLGQESRDIGQFVDDDGTAYLLFESRPTGGFFIARLTDDFLGVKEQTAFVHAPLEGGALVHYAGLYYVMGSHMSGWKANPNVYATAQNLSGPWTEFRNIAPPATNTDGSQSTFLLNVEGSQDTSVIYMGDRWEPDNLPDSRYIWMPVTMGGRDMTLPPLQPWSIDMKTGTTKLYQAQKRGQKNEAPQQNLWVNSGSGRAPRV